MKLRELAELLLTARKTAGRIGCTYKLRENAVTGVSVADEMRVMEVVLDIERFQETALSSLGQPMRNP